MNHHHNHLEGIIEPCPSPRLHGTISHYLNDLPLRLIDPRISLEYVQRSGHSLLQEMREFQLCTPRDMHTLIQPGPGGRDAGVRLMECLLHEDTRNYVVWLSDSHFITANRSLPNFFGGGVGENLGLVKELQLNDLRVYYDRNAQGVAVTTCQQVADVLFRLLGWSVIPAPADEPSRLPYIAYSSMLRSNHFPVSTDALQVFVSEAVSPRVIEFEGWFQTKISSEQGRTFAFRCNQNVELHANLVKWEDKGQSLIEAMRLNQCPAKLNFTHNYHFSPDLVEALTTTTSIEEITVGNREVIDAICQNPSIMAITFINRGLGTFDDWKCFYEKVLSSTSIQTIKTTGVVYDDRDYPVRPQDPHDATTVPKLIAQLLRSNTSTIVTSIQYEPNYWHDTATMEEQVVPLLKFNRFRPVVASIHVGTNREQQEKSIVALLQSNLVRNRPEFLFHLLNTHRDVWLRQEVAP